MDTGSLKRPARRRRENTKTEMVVVDSVQSSLNMWLLYSRLLGFTVNECSVFYMFSRGFTIYSEVKEYLISSTCVFLDGSTGKSKKNIPIYLWYGLIYLWFGLIYLWYGLIHIDIVSNIIQ